MPGLCRYKDCLSSDSRTKNQNCRGGRGVRRNTAMYKSLVVVTNTITSSASAQVFPLNYTWIGWFYCLSGLCVGHWVSPWLPAAVDHPLAALPLHFDNPSPIGQYQSRISGFGSETGIIYILLVYCQHITKAGNGWEKTSTGTTVRTWHQQLWDFSFSNMSQTLCILPMGREGLPPVFLL